MKDLQPMRKIRDIQKLMHNNIRCECEKRGINSTYRHIIFHLTKQEGLTQLEIVRKTLFSAPTISLTLQKMELEGLIDRKQDEKDARIMRVYLTDLGRSFENTVKEVIDHFETIALSNCSLEEISLLTQLLSKIEKNIGKEDV